MFGGLTTLRSLTLATVLSHSPNRCVSAGVSAALREIASLRSATSDTPQPLSEIPNPAIEGEKHEQGRNI